MHVAHAAEAIALGKCDVALITLAGRPRSEGARTGITVRDDSPAQPDLQWEYPFGATTVNLYAMCAMRHMYEFGTTSEQLAWIKVAASNHAQHNPNAMLRNVVTVEEVVHSPMVADPLHRLDCCVISDGGGALAVVRPEIARRLNRPRVKILGAGEAPKGQARRRRGFDVFGRGLVRSRGLCGSGHKAQRYQIYFDLRQFYDYGADSDRGSGLFARKAKVASLFPAET